MRVKVSHTADADPSVALPAYETAGAAGADVRANLGPNGGALTIAPGERRLVPTGLIFEIPQGFEVQVRPRSGLALKHGIALVNSPGTIDADYRGPVGVIVINHGSDPFEIAHGDRIAQLVLASVVQADFAIEGSLEETARGERGFGSTGVQ